jgi:hypothetical protein
MKNEMEKTIKAVKYMIDIWDEVTGKKWRERPDHVQQKFLEAEKELKSEPSTARLSANRPRRLDNFPSFKDI